MKAERWRQVERLYHAALQRGAEGRAVFLAEACAGDDSLRREVESLLAYEDAAENFIESPALEVAAQMMAEGQVATVVAGQTINQYGVISPLGAGGMGEVFLAEDTRLGRRVALKFLPALLTQDEGHLLRFEQEARAVASLSHPNVCTIHEVVKTGEGRHCIVMEYVEGVTLRERMAEGQMEVGEALDAAVQVASALAAAHAAGVVHRDIKPENVMLRRDRIVKVLDFGLAKLAPQQLVVDAQSPIRSMAKTNPGVVMGTVGYMSPEQARGEEADARTDIWSLGVVLYEMLTGRAPFEGVTPSHVIVSILESEPPALSLDAEVPAELERIVAKALCTSREERHQTAGELARDLENLKEELKVEARLRRGHQPSANGKESAAGGDWFRMGAIREPARTGHVIPARSTSSVEYLVGRVKRHKTFAATALLVFLVGAIGLTYLAINWSKANPSAAGKKSIAVLPLKPINAANRDELYELGIADSLIHRLGSTKGIIVRPLNATRKYADIEQDPLAAGREQQVDYVLVSNYQLADGKIRITAQLFNVAGGQIEETYKIEKGAGDLFGMQDAVANEFGNKLTARFATTASSPAAKRWTTNEEAYRLYLQAMYLYDKRDQASALRAIELLEQAVRLDPNYALAWAGKAHVHRSYARIGGRKTNHQEEYKKSIEAINKALTLDANLSEAHSALCENKFLTEYDFAGAESACRRALELNPNSSLAHQIYSRFLMGRGRSDEAIAEIKTAIDLEPTSLYNQRLLGNCLLNARRYEEAVVQFKRVIAMDEDFGTANPWLSSTLGLQGRDAEAFEWFMKGLVLQKSDEETVRAFQTAFQTSGWQGVLRERAERFEKGNELYVSGAAYNAQIGNKDKAFEYLEKSLQRREWGLHILPVDPHLDNLRDDPRFAELVRRVELK